MLDVIIKKEKTKPCLYCLCSIFGFHNTIYLACVIHFIRFLVIYVIEWYNVLSILSSMDFDWSVEFCTRSLALELLK